MVDGGQIIESCLMSKVAFEKTATIEESTDEGHITDFLPLSRGKPKQLVWKEGKGKVVDGWLTKT